MENNNIIKLPTGTIIFNGGNALEGCPNDWKEAEAWILKVNENKEEYTEPMWRFDCGFKLDFDGPIVRISSRFYPPKTHYGPTWDGNVTVMLLDKEVAKKSFDCKTLEELKAEVEKYTKEVQEKIANLLNQ